MAYLMRDDVSEHVRCLASALQSEIAHKGVENVGKGAALHCKSHRVVCMPQRLSGDKTPFRYVRNLEAASVDAALSPDGYRLAYVTMQGGTAQVVVQSFPAPSQLRQQISRDGGRSPRWRRDGHEIFYIDGASRMIAVPVEPDGTIAVARSRALFTAPRGLVVSSFDGFSYDVTPNGQRFLFSVFDGGVRPDSPMSPVNVVVNWPATLKK